MAESAKPEGRTRKLLKSVYESIIEIATNHRAESQAASGALGAFIKKCEEEHGVNRKAMKLIMWCNTAPQSQLADFLRSFDEMRKLAKLDDKAGKDLFAAEEAETSEAKAALDAKGKSNDNDAPLKH